MNLYSNIYIYFNIYLSIYMFISLCYIILVWCTSFLNGLGLRSRNAVLGKEIYNIWNLCKGSTRKPWHVCLLAYSIVQAHIPRLKIFVYLLMPCDSFFVSHLAASRQTSDHFRRHSLTYSILAALRAALGSVWGDTITHWIMIKNGSCRFDLLSTLEKQRY